MEYSIKKLSELAGVSARTLRYYDEIDLLKPAYVTEAGYRYYGEEELALLQQILFYKERGFELQTIADILYDKDFDTLHALEGHLSDLLAKRKRIEALITTVRKTIRSMKGEITMNNQEKFTAFKESIIKENESRYGEELRSLYGAGWVEKSNQQIQDMTKEDMDRFQKLEQEIHLRLEKAVKAKEEPKGEEAHTIVDLHKEWLMMAWKEYCVKAHQGLAEMYTADERFRSYYDGKVPGCAEFLKQAIVYWLKES